MKELGRGERGTAVIELSEQEYNAFRALVGACGESNPVWQPPRASLNEEPIEDWIEAVRLFAIQVERIKELKDVVDMMHARLLLKNDKS